jgi:predicted MPP superfamily phosphohydrolase
MPAELTTLHFTDIHEDTDKLAIIKQYASKVDVVFFTGDIMEGHPTGNNTTIDRVIKQIQETIHTPDIIELSKQSNEILKKYVSDGKVDKDAIEEEDRTKLVALNEEINILAEKKIEEGDLLGKILKAPKQTYQTLETSFQEIAKIAPVYGILGNHDLTLAYEHIDSITFLETTKEARIKGKTGIEFIIKGDLNTWEVPPAWSQQPLIYEAFKEHLIPYISGNSIDNLDEKIKQALKTGNENSASNLQSAKDNKDNIKAWQDQERARLGDTDADIYLTHKLPDCDKARRTYGFATGDITREYSANAKSVLGGHFHDGQIGYKTIPTLLEAANDNETIEVDGNVVPLIKIDKDEPWQLNAGTEYFFIASYNKEKDIEHVDVYQYTYETAA